MSLYAVLREALALCIGRRLTFAAFRVPGGPVRLWAQRQPAAGAADRTLFADMERVFLAVPFNMGAGPVPFIRADVDLTFTEAGAALGLLGPCTGSEERAEQTDTPTGHAEFRDAVHAAVQACAGGRLRKVVLSRVKGADIPPGRWPELFIWALEAAPGALVAMACTPEHGLWMGASPERLVHAHGGRVRVDSIAATRPADAVPGKIADWGAKELDEQAQVTAYLRDLFADMHLRDVKITGPRVLGAGPVAHLHTVLEADRGDVPLMDLVARLHPTPAVCGVPVEAARHFIAAHERHPRSLYTGFWGPWNVDGTTDLFVNLRCMRHRAGRTALLAGAGITAGSDADMEWAETERKARTWLRALETSAQAD